jgi:hypothetical protein
MGPVALQAQEHRDQVYHDRDHNDDHHWDSREDKAYGVWQKETHRAKRTFTRLKDDEQQSYWRWRHEHSDDQLKITIKR